MRPKHASYTVWREIDYRPVVEEIFPESLLSYLGADQTVLEVGCNKGGAAIFLAEHGLQVHGIDINPAAIDTAQHRAAERGLDSAHFSVADVLASKIPRYDAVVAIRVLTCFPEVSHRRYALSRMYHALLPGGVLYIEDFMLSPKSYAHRYAQGAEDGLGEGNFAVNDGVGNLLFVAHHHSTKEIERMKARYDPLSVKFFEGLSMSGNVVNMFEFIGRKPDMETK